MSVFDHTSIGEYSFIAANGGVRIGPNVVIGHHVSVITSNHRFDDPMRPIAEQGVQLRSIEIGDNVWVGSGARILAGVTIGDGAVIGANSVVTRSVAPGAVVAGVPARWLRQRGSRLRAAGDEEAKLNG